MGEKQNQDHLTNLYIKLNEDHLTNLYLLALKQICQWNCLQRLTSENSGSCTIWRDTAFQLGISMSIICRLLCQSYSRFWYWTLHVNMVTEYTITNAENMHNIYLPLVHKFIWSSSFVPPNDIYSNWSNILKICRICAMIRRICTLICRICKMMCKILVQGTFSAYCAVQYKIIYKIICVTT